MEKERKYKDVPIDKLLDFIGKDIPYEDDKNRDKQQDYKDEIEKRYPFDRIRRRINRQEQEIKELKNAMELFMYHTHTENGDIVIPASKTRELWRYR